jgi:hypothetical protein
LHGFLTGGLGFLTGCAVPAAELSFAAAAELSFAAAAELSASAATVTVAAQNITNRFILTPLNVHSAGILRPRPGDPKAFS